jgi:hypothetical protein
MAIGKEMQGMEGLKNVSDGRYEKVKGFLWSLNEDV